MVSHNVVGASMVVRVLLIIMLLVLSEFFNIEHVHCYEASKLTAI